MYISLRDLDLHDKDGPREDTVQIVVDGKNYPFSVSRLFGQIDPRTAEGKREFRELVTALASSEQKSFVIKFPKFKYEERFSLLDARKVLGSDGGKDFILDRCETHP
jgi:hypothetical protein